MVIGKCPRVRCEPLIHVAGYVRKLRDICRYHSVGSSSPTQAAAAQW